MKLAALALSTLMFSSACLSDGDGADADAFVGAYRNTLTVSGNGSMSAVVYAPNADISAKGGGNSGFMMGSLVGYSLKFTGNDCFYYDESLGDDDDGSRLAIDEWDEIVAYVDPKNKEIYDKMRF